jgi:hypothetical protein
LTRTLRLLLGSKQWNPPRPCWYANYLDPPKGWRIHGDFYGKVSIPFGLWDSRTFMQSFLDMHCVIFRL